MPPKKVAAVTKVTVSTTVAECAAPSKNQCQLLKGVNRRISTVVFLHKRPPVLKMVLHALKKSKDRKGTTVPAIRNYILSTYPAVNPVYLKTSLKRALAIGLEKGILIRPANSKATGATGRFKLAAKNVKKRDSENVDPNSESAKVNVKSKAKRSEANKKPDTSKIKSASLSKGEESGQVKKPKQPSGNSNKKSKAVKTEPASLSKGLPNKASKPLPPTDTVVKQGPMCQGKKRAPKEPVPSSRKAGPSASGSLGVKEAPEGQAKKSGRPKKKVQKE